MCVRVCVCACVCAIDIVPIVQSPWLLHLPARHCGLPVSLYEQQSYLHHYCPRMLLVVVLVGFPLRRVIGATIEACPRPLSGTQTLLSLTHTLSLYLLCLTIHAHTVSTGIDREHQLHRVPNAPYMCVCPLRFHPCPSCLRSLSCTSRSHGSRFCVHSIHRSAYMYLSHTHILYYTLNPRSHSLCNKFVVK